MFAKGKGSAVPSDGQAREKFDGKKTSHWESLLGFCTRGGVYFGTFTVQPLKGETLVNIQVKQKPFMIISVASPPPAVPSFVPSRPLSSGTELRPEELVI
ncbi:hypothetical protein STEG23_027002 [Scotinomys teguina]